MKYVHDEIAAVRKVAWPRPHRYGPDYPPGITISTQGTVIGDLIKRAENAPSTSLSDDIPEPRSLNKSSSGTGSQEGPLLTLAHDYFTQRGGAERVAQALAVALRPANIITGSYVPKRSFALPETSTLTTTFIDRLPIIRSDPRLGFPLLPIAWRLVRPVTNGVVLCSSSGWSHALRVAPGVPKIVYCHNPPRWIYQTEEYIAGQPLLVRLAARLFRPIMRRVDQQTAKTVAAYIANSRVVAERIRRIYGAEASVIHPPVTIDITGKQTPVEHGFGSFFLSVGRIRGYKNTQRLIDAFALMPDQHLFVVGDNTLTAKLPPNVMCAPRVSEAELRWLYANCRALMSVAQEDFGLTPIEANAFGSPALVVREGGFLDSLDEHVSGEFIASRTISDIVAAVTTFPMEWNREAIVRHAGRFSLTSFITEIKSVLMAKSTPPRATSSNEAEVDAVAAPHERRLASAAKDARPVR